MCVYSKVVQTGWSLSVPYLNTMSNYNKARLTKYVASTKLYLNLLKFCCYANNTTPELPSYKLRCAGISLSDECLECKKLSSVQTW